MKNRILSLIRSSNSKKRIPSELVVPFEQGEDISDIAPSAEESFISQREAEYITSVISLNLTKQEKEIFMLYLKGMSYEDTRVVFLEGMEEKVRDNEAEFFEKYDHHKILFLYGTSKKQRLVVGILRLN